MAVAGAAPAFASSPVPRETVDPTDPGTSEPVPEVCHLTGHTEAEVRQRWESVVSRDGFAEPIHTRQPSLTNPYDQGELSES